MKNNNSITHQTGMDGKDKIQQVHDTQNPYESIHARQLCEMIVESPREIDKWIDAVIEDDIILRSLFGDKEYLRIKDKLSIRKPILNLDNSSFLMGMPEFKSIFEKLKNRKIAEKQAQEDKVKGEILRDNLHEIDLSDELLERKKRIEQCKEIVKKLNARKDTKDMISYGRSYNEMLKYFKNKQDDIVNVEDAKIIYDFIFDYIESNYNKKKRNKSESSPDFFIRNGDYLFSGFIENLKQEEIKFKNESTKFREKNKAKILKSTSREIKTSLLAPNLDEDEIKKEALHCLIDNIKHGRIDSIKDRFYLEKDLEDMKRINTTIKEWSSIILETIDFNSLKLELQQGKDEIIKGNNISVHKNHYYEIKNRIKKYDKWIENQNENSLRGFIFDRLIEFIGIAITKYRIDEIIKNNVHYKGTSYRIFKTDFLDDTYGGADFIILFKFPSKKERKEEIAAIDLLTSRTKFNRNVNDEKDPVKEEKEGKAQESRFLYSSYIDLLKKSEYKMFKLKALKRIVIEEDARTSYHFLSELMKGKISDLQEYINKFFLDKGLGKPKKIDESTQKIVKILDGSSENIEVAA